MDPPETRYAKSGDLSIACQVTGSGPLDLVFVPGFVSNLDAMWEDPGWAHWFTRLALFSRLIRFDKRNTGLSDRAAGIANLEERMDDVRAVMDAVCSGSRASPRAELDPLLSIFPGSTIACTRANSARAASPEFLDAVAAGLRLAGVPEQ